MCLLKYIPPIKHDFYRTLRTTRGDQDLHLNNSEEDDVCYDE